MFIPSKLLIVDAPIVQCQMYHAQNPLPRKNCSCSSNRITRCGGLGGLGGLAASDYSVATRAVTVYFWWSYPMLGEC